MTSSWPGLNHRQGVALARLLHELRADWDVEGVHRFVMIARDKGSGPEVAVAAIRAASNPHNRTPAVIPMDGEHWRTPVTAGRATTPRPRPLLPEERCRTCNRSEAECLGPLHPLDGHTFEPDLPRLPRTEPRSLREEVAAAQGNSA